MGELFGTDGIRGTANRGTVTASTALAVAMAAGSLMRRGGKRPLAVIGRDTRLSGSMLESALTAGFTAVGMDVATLGVVPTSAVGMLTRAFDGDIGMMISASQTPYADNGLRVFGPDGYPLPPKMEARIEASVREGGHEMAVSSAQLGRQRRVGDAARRYAAAAKASVPAGIRLDGLTVVVDGAHGSGARIAPAVLRTLGARVVEVACAPDGFNINANCGASLPAAMQAAIRTHSADLGIALDGDGDCAVLADEAGDVIDGDQILAAIAGFQKGHGLLRGDGVVGTWASNFGLDLYLQTLGLAFRRDATGPHRLAESLRISGCSLGGEPSGHVVLSDWAATGDGLIAALQALALVAESGMPASRVLRPFELLPQRLTNVRARPGLLDTDEARAAIAGMRTRLNGHGHLQVRAAENEAVIRVMAGGTDASLVDEVVGSLANRIAELNQKRAINLPVR